MPKNSFAKKSKNDKSSAEKSADKVEVKAVMETAKAAGSQKPTKFVKLLHGTQFTDRDSGDIYLIDKLTPVKEITSWVRIQAEFGLFEIVE